MTYRLMAALLGVTCLLPLANCPAAEAVSEPSIQYIPISAPIDAPPGTWQTAVIVDQMPLVHTRQLFPFDSDGKLVGEDSAERQIEQVLTNLDAVLNDAGGSMDKLIRVNVYALSAATVTSLHECLGRRLDASVRPAITSVLTPLPYRGVLLAVDAVAGARDAGQAMKLWRSQSVAGDEKCADAAVLPAGGIAYLSGQPAGFELTTLPTTRSMDQLMKTLKQLQLGPEHVAQIKIFLNPISSAEDVLGEVQAFFPDGLTPPVVFVEWLASVPVEIEMVAQWSPSDRPAEPVMYFNPPEYRPSNSFSRAALMWADRQIYIAGLYASKPSRGEPQAHLLFGQLDEVLKKTGSDMRHLVKTNYYTSDDDAARWVDRTRPKIFDPMRPPAASKVMVHGVGLSERTMTVDMIAVEAK